MKKRAIAIRKARRADTDAMARVLLCCWRTSYRGIVPDSHLDSMTLAERKGNILREFDWMRERADRTFLVAEVAGEVVGFAGGGKERGGRPGFEGELYAIYVAPGSRRTGVGRALLARLAGWLADEGFARMLLWTFEDNAPAQRFYEALGGRLLPDRRTIERGGADLSLVAYGWDDLAQLVKTLEARTGGAGPQP